MSGRSPRPPAPGQKRRAGKGGGALLQGLAGSEPPSATPGWRQSGGSTPTPRPLCVHTPMSTRDRRGSTPAITTPGEHRADAGGRQGAVAPAGSQGPSGWGQVATARVGGTREKVRALDRGQSTAPAAGDSEQAAPGPRLSLGTSPPLPALHGDRMGTGHPLLHCYC